MADNTQVNPGIGGDVIRDIDRSGVKTQVTALDAGGAAGESLVSLTNPLPTAASATNFIASTGNSSTAQLGPGAAFTGTIETVLSQVALSLLIDTDQTCSVTINQYISSDPTTLMSSWTYPVTSTGFNRAFALNGNFANIVVTNTSASSTTVLNINAYYGTIEPVSQLGNRPVAITEVGGVAVGSSLPVTDNGNSLTVDTGVAGGPLSVVDPATRDAATGDAPLQVMLTGDPSGNWAGVNLLEQVVEDGTGIGFNVKVINQEKLDVNKAIVLSDAPAPISMSSLAVNTLVSFCDTTGYQSVVVQITNAGSATVTYECSNDGANWAGVSGWSSLGSGTTISSSTTALIIQFPAIARYFRARISVASALVSAVTYLRATPLVLLSTTPAVNVSQISAGALPSPSPLGSSSGHTVLPVGGGADGVHALPGDTRAPGATAGATPVAITATQNAFSSGSNTPYPVGVAGADINGYVRRLMTDNYGRIQVSGAIPPTNILGTALAPVKDGSDFEGLTVVELLAQVLQELRISNVYACFLSAQFGGIDDPTMLRNDPSIFQS